MASALKWKAPVRKTRLIFSDDPGRVDVITKNPGKVFAVIGPFDDHTDKGDLQDMLETILRGYNLEPR